MNITQSPPSPADTQAWLIALQHLMPIDSHLLLIKEYTLALLIFMAASGLIVGFLSGFIGVAGGMFTVSFLVLLAPFVFGADIITVQAATGVAAVQGLASTISGSMAHFRNKALNLGFLWYFGLPSIVGSYIGTQWSAQWSRNTILMVMASLLASAIYLGLKKYQAMGHPTFQTPEPLTRIDQFIWPHWCIQLVCIVIGVLSGILGIGGAVLLVPLMSDGQGMPLRQAIITATGSVVLTSVGTLIGKAQAGLIPWEFSLLVSMLAFVGGWIGARTQGKVGNRSLRMFHIGLMLLMLAETIRKLFFS
jgi:uncharacterized membrane protein YfcA